MPPCRAAMATAQKTEFCTHARLAASAGLPLPCAADGGIVGQAAAAGHPHSRRGRSGIRCNRR
ncbi:hypothetical protein C666_03070 [Thauera linaloolentis 47Lol = DSM 12138]|uniref:Uncharacterized protein n=1 Tax=Thauera linaloolentis (strain DSM 12138 / JCM 21573 / CCUG 41526 / CIP 105981 / IAM 15112 / NBRC 102519 / 47Lol) TaxID=1123367 RepID=N6Y7D9_THAL4|nr:hypothetical protein C666_03070 [Thauera linaloolentis 47Lol = DSM 12138]